MTAHNNHSMKVSVVVLVVAVLATGAAGPSPALSTARGPTKLVTWSPENLPPDVERSLDRIYGVRATTVSLGLDWMSSARAGGRVLDDPPRGYRIPIEVAFVKPYEYRHYVPARARDEIVSLGRGEALISSAGKRLRGHGKGLRLRFGSRVVKVIGVISNEAAQGYELVMARPAPGELRTVRSVLVEKGPRIERARIRRVISRELEPGKNLGLRSENEVRYLRYAEVVHPHVTFKRAFGEFAARSGSGTSISIHPDWVNRNIRSDSVPILGSVTCHRKLFRQLRGALGEIQRKGLAHLIRRDEYAGCYNARYVAAAAGARLSRHSWGIALDINARSNPYGSRPSMDGRVIKIFRSWGFVWGGAWPTPDGMHFEWRAFPS